MATNEKVGRERYKLHGTDPYVITGTEKQKKRG